MPNINTNQTQTGLPKQAVVLTENWIDYAMIAAARNSLAIHFGFSQCWPVCKEWKRPWIPLALASRYEVFTFRFDDLMSDQGFSESNQYFLESLLVRSDEIVSIHRNMTPAELIFALHRALALGWPLMVDEQYHQAQPTAEMSWNRAEGKAVVLARQDSMMAIPAALYAAVTGKQFLTVESLSHGIEHLTCHPPSSLILVDDLTIFNKSFLEEMLGWSLSSVVAPLPFGILSGRTPEHLSAIVCRLLLHREFFRCGHRLAEPPRFQRVPIREMQAMEYYILGAHGNEMHLRHTREEVLCGASENRTREVSKFDCEPRCRFTSRIRSSELPAHIIFLLSCDAFNTGDGLVPSDFNVFLNLFDGWTASALAPFKHVQGSGALISLVSALASSGFSLGEIALRLNSICRIGSPPDPAYLILGDPDLVVQSNRRAPFCPIVAEEVGDQFEIPDSAIFHLVAEVTLNEVTKTALRSLLISGGFPAIEPCSEELIRTDIFFALWSMPSRDQVVLTLFSEREFSGQPIRLQLTVANGLDDISRQAALLQLRRLFFLKEIGINRAVVDEVEEKILGLLRAVAGYPRDIDQILGNGLARNISNALIAQSPQLRHRILTEILQEMEKNRLWISQNYSHAYPRLIRASSSSDGPCHFCGQCTVRWIYQDSLTELPERQLVICSRCGIVADVPAEHEVEFQLHPNPLLCAQQVITIRNLTKRSICLSFFLHFNQWKDLGLTVEPGILDLELAAEEESQLTLELRASSASALGDEILQMQVYGLTDSFQLYFVSQKVLSIARSGSGPLT